MLNFGASKPRVRGGARAPGAPPWIRGWGNMKEYSRYFLVGQYKSGSVCKRTMLHIVQAQGILGQSWQSAPYKEKKVSLRVIECHYILRLSMFYQKLINVDQNLFLICLVNGHILSEECSKTFTLILVRLWVRQIYLPPTNEVAGR